MSFTTPCFIRKNTPELRKNLEDIGYIHIPSKTECSQGGCIYTHFREWLGAYDYQDHERYFKNHIDCGTNEDLFLAIAALRDDSDKNQYFTNGGIFIKCEYDEFHFYSFPTNGATGEVSPPIDLKDYFHKATIQELVEHFK